MSLSEDRANALVVAYILEKFRDESKDSHLATCPEVRVDDPDAYDGTYGCDTGCEYVRFDAVITCPHDEREDFEWGEFGYLDTIIKDLDKQAAKAAG